MSDSINARHPDLIDAEGDRWSWCGHGDVYAADEDDRATEYARVDAEQEFGPMREADAL